MAEKKKEHNLECTSGVHKDHLCFLMCEGWHLSHQEEYKAMVKDAEYRCRYCDRTAKSEHNLCYPVDL